MRQLFLATTIILASVFLTQTLSAQESVRERIERRQGQQNKNNVPQLSIRAENMNASQTQGIDNAPWIREIYRFVDLRKEKNASLYYPEYPLGDRMNLFTMMFRLLANGDITAYEYLIDGREIFTDEFKLNFKELLNSEGIMYTEQNGKFIIADSDIPSNEVLGYYLKEAWYFDQSNSVVDVKTLAVCPIIFRQDDFDVETTRYALFWLPYESLRPYAARMPIMTSNLNNASTQTIDDYFRKRLFDGEIYKTTNMRNRFLAQDHPTDSLLKKEQRKIESELKQFNKNLWVLNDSVPAKAVDTKATAKSKNSKTTTPKASPATKTKEPKVEKAKSSTPARSMRTRRQ